MLHEKLKEVILCNNRPVYTVIMGHCGGMRVFVLMVHDR